MNNAVPDGGGGGGNYASIKITGMTSLLSQITTAGTTLQHHPEPAEPGQRL